MYMYFSSVQYFQYSNILCGHYKEFVKIMINFHNTVQLWLIVWKFWAILSKTLIIFFASWKKYPKLGNRRGYDRWWMINVSCKRLVKEPPFITVTIFSCLSCTDCHIGHLIVVTHFSTNSFQSCKNRNWKTLCKLKKSACTILEVVVL